MHLQELLEVQDLDLTIHKKGEEKITLSTDIEISSNGIDLDEIINDFEKGLLLKALDKTHGVKTKAAKLLNISFRSLRYRLEKHGVDALDE